MKKCFLGHPNVQSSVYKSIGSGLERRGEAGREGREAQTERGSLRRGFRAGNPTEKRNIRCVFNCRRFFLKGIERDIFLLIIDFFYNDLSEIVYNKL